MVLKRNVFAYIRVSTTEQREDRQVDAMMKHDVPKKNMYMDKVSGKNFDRPAYRRLQKRLSAGDLLIVKSIDRLGRNYSEIIEQWRYLTHEKQIDIKVLDMPLLDTSYCRDLLGTLISDLTLQVLSFVAQLERETMLARQAEGIAAAKKRGVQFGRRKNALPDDFADIYNRWIQKQITATEAAALCNFTQRTWYNRTESLRKGTAPVVISGKNIY